MLSSHKVQTQNYRLLLQSYNLFSNSDNFEKPWQIHISKLFKIIDLYEQYRLPVQHFENMQYFSNAFAALTINVLLDHLLTESCLRFSRRSFSLKYENSFWQHYNHQFYSNTYGICCTIALWKKWWVIFCFNEMEHFTWNHDARSFWRLELRHGTQYTLQGTCRSWCNLRNRNTASDNSYITRGTSQVDRSNCFYVLWKIATSCRHYYFKLKYM